MTITPADVVREHGPLVARYDEKSLLCAIHMDMDEDYSARLADAKAGNPPPEGGFYLAFDLVDKTDEAGA
jgi:hypothetical protein